MTRLNYVKGSLSLLAAVFVVEWIPGPWSPWRGMGNAKAIGVDVLAIGFLDALLMPSFWLAVLTLFTLFLAASHLRNRLMRTLLFWLPAGASSLLGLAIVTFATIFHFRQP